MADGWFITERDKKYFGMADVKMDDVVHHGPCENCVKLGEAKTCPHYLKAPFVPTKELCVAFDIETKGASLDHAIIQIGVAYGTSLEDIKTTSFCFDQKDSPFEKRCYDEFWTKHLDILARIEKEAVNDVQQWENFAEFVDDLEKLSSKVGIVSDNPAFDISRIDNDMSSYGVRQREHEMTFGAPGGKPFPVDAAIPLRYTSDGKYRQVKDPSERIQGLPKKVQEEINFKVAAAVKDPHWAEDDARGILTMHFLVQQAIKDVNGG